MRFEFELILSLPREVVFAFHQSPGNLPRVYGASGCRLLRHPPRVEAGAQVWVKMPIAVGLGITLGFEHWLCEPPMRFAERCIHGVFSQFDHLHEFHEHEAGTLIRDHLEIRLPWHFGGELAMQWLVAPRVRQVFHERSKGLLALTASGELQRLAASQVIEASSCSA